MSKFTQRPDLFKAVVCSVPLLDMFRYSQLLAGASWMAEYGDPSKSEEWEYIQKYSPYHNVKPDQTYPKLFFITSTKDDRVHPGHVRKMAALLEDLGTEILFMKILKVVMELLQIMRKWLLCRLYPTVFFSKNLNSMVIYIRCYPRRFRK